MKSLLAVLMTLLSTGCHAANNTKSQTINWCFENTDYLVEVTRPEKTLESRLILRDVKGQKLDDIEGEVDLIGFYPINLCGSDLVLIWSTTSADLDIQIVKIQNKKLFVSLDVTSQCIPTMRSKSELEICPSDGTDSTKNRFRSAGEGGKWVSGGANPSK